MNTEELTEAYVVLNRRVTAAEERIGFLHGLVRQLDEKVQVLQQPLRDPAHV